MLRNADLVCLGGYLAAGIIKVHQLRLMYTGLRMTAYSEYMLTRCREDLRIKQDIGERAIHVNSGCIKA